MVLESRQDFAGALIPLSIDIELLLDLLNLTVDTAELNHIHLLTRYARNPQIETVKSIARALDCTLEDFDDSPRVRTLSTDEYDLIQQYRLLDSAGQEVVRYLLTKELERLQNLGVIPAP